MIRRLRIDENEVRFMRKTKGVMLGAVFFYIWYVYTAAVLHFADFMASGVWYKILKISAPLTLLGGEGAGAALIYGAPILFLVATVILDLLPEFIKAQKIALSVMPVVSYALFWIFGFFADAYFGYK